MATREEGRWPGSDRRGGTINDLGGELPRTPAVSFPTYGERADERRASAEELKVLLISGLIGLGALLFIVLLLVLNWLY